MTRQAISPRFATRTLSKRGRFWCWCWCCADGGSVCAGSRRRRSTHEVVDVDSGVIEIDERHLFDVTLNRFDDGGLVEERTRIICRSCNIVRWIQLDWIGFDWIRFDSILDLINKSCVVVRYFSACSLLGLPRVHVYVCVCVHVYVYVLPDSILICQNE